MPIEIERRFLVSGFDWKKYSKSKKNIKQSYLTSNKDEWAVRIRIIDEKDAWITLKKFKQKSINHEFEYRIPFKEAKSIHLLSSFHITKQRYYLSINEQDWIVDYFQDNNHPLIIAEIELKELRENIQIPKWCQQEITGNHLLSNASLARHPIKFWAPEELQQINLK
tara:strand:+ start:299 stop:799 length:501 start_codon:yes stop_codon:yes gene_type:complete